MGAKKQRNRMKKSLNKNLITLAGKPMIEATSARYLGDFLSYSLGESVHQTVLKRLGVAKKSIYDIRAVVEDKRAEHVGGFNLCLEIFQSTTEQMLFFNSETWTCIPKKTIKILDDLYTSMYRIFLRASTGSPKVNYYWQCATLTVSNIILLKKILFVYHLANLPLESLGRECFEAQFDQLPQNSLVTEVKEHLDNLNFENSRNMNKFQFKRVTKAYVNNLNKNQLLERIRESKKINFDECVNEEFKRKAYFTELKLRDVRLRFKASSSMLETFKCNFPSKYRKKSLACQHCRSTNLPTDKQTEQPRDSQFHALTACPQCDTICLQYDTSTDLGLVQFFRAVLEKRLEEEEI